ncbi:CRISPR-associated CARF protein Csa3 [Bacteroidota bacterium]
MKVLIATIFEGRSNLQTIPTISPEKIYFIVDTPIHEKRQTAINAIQHKYPEIKIEKVFVKHYDVVDVAKNVIGVMESEKSNELFVNITEGRKTMSIGLLFGAYMMKEFVKSVFYITEETNDQISLPLVDLKVKNGRKDLLELIKNGTSSTDELSKKLDITSGHLYVQLKELRDKGFISKENKITELGKIAILN